MLSSSADFQPTPIHLTIGHEHIDIESLDEAIDFLRSLRHDRLGGFAEMLLLQMEAAKAPHQKSEAWTAFRTWSTACGLHGGKGPLSRAA
ncbi:hypothetical protein MKI84_01965 [Ancylobacter sp. A5.8]|uniref:hypothetical protein n=1 Tax=Ancylobacter gelatini TaxID=2919920 RepID=UPI001F4EADCD|nr:hypothetical protein [Ancylobacter gelatini]MCJ8141675.1 hypothetical protein [Ancylobacter gelatini]